MIAIYLFCLANFSGSLLRGVEWTDPYQ